jgi:transposase
MTDLIVDVIDGVDTHKEVHAAAALDRSAGCSLRRRHGKTDMVDAIAAGRVVVAGTATSVAKSTTGLVECIRLLRIARRSALKARTQVINQFHSVVDTAPEDLRAELSSVRLVEQLRRAARFRNAEPVTPRAAAKVALTSISRRWAGLQDEIDLLDSQLQALT